MMYLLDTVVVSETRKIKAGGADPGVASWGPESTDNDLAYVSAITIRELELGVLLAEGRDPASGAVLRCRLDKDVYVAFDGRVLAGGRHGGTIGRFPTCTGSSACERRSHRRHRHSEQHGPGNP